MADFKFPDDILSQHIAVLGKTGSGKTSTAKLLIEQVVRSGARVCVLDPIKSDWWGMTSSADGKRAGLPFHILGGPRGHVPLHERAGKAIGELVATGGLPLSIIDMADFPPGGQAHFFVDFAPTLLRRMRGVVYVVLEEAHLFAPKERSGVGAENMSIHWAKMLATAGRSKGIRLVLATQRTQALHNALLGSCDTLIAHRLTAPADQAPVVSWLKANVDAETLGKVAGSLASLRTGQAWLCSGEAKVFEQVSFPRIATFDNTATPTADSEIREVKTAAVDVEKLRAAIGEAVKDAEDNDPKLLRAEIAKLRKIASSVAPADNSQLVTALRQELGAVTRSRDTLQLVLNGWHDRARQISKTLLESVGDVALGTEAPDKLAAAVVRNEVRKPTPNAVIPPAVKAGTTAPAGGPEQRILDSIAWWHAAGVEHPTRHQVAFVANYTVNGHFNNLAGTLRTKGLIDYPTGGALGLTPAGACVARAPDSAPTRAELVDRVTAVLKGEPLRRIFGVLVHRDGPLARKDLAEAAGYTENGHFNNIVGSLNGIGVVEYPTRGQVGLSSIFKDLA